MKTALITGSATRLGRIMALHLAQQGYAIALHYHTSHAAAQQTQREIVARGQSCQVFQQDLREETAATALFAQIHARMGHVEVLINNAAIFMRDTLETLSTELFLHHQQVNVLAPLRLSQVFAASVSQGQIINLLDQKAHRPNSDFLSYTLSKIALQAATLMLARDFAPQVRVNGIALGTIIPAPTQRDSHFQAMRENTPLKIGASFADVYRALDFLLHTPSVTGQILTLDGGAFLTD